jgi:tripartite-type tricarboxylate transporter receptor subunit TctC
MNRRDVLILGGAASAAALTGFPAVAQTRYPARPIRLVVPFSAGGVNDIVGRQWAEKVRTRLGSVYVENQGGAGGTIGVVEVGRSEPDGHTVLLGSTSTMVLNTMTMQKPPYDPNRDFVPVCVMCVSATSIAVNAALPVKNLKDLIAYGKNNPGKLSYGSAGTGTMSHLSGELFKQLTGMADMVHIPYKGAGPGLADLVSGHIQVMSPNVTGQVLDLHATGKIRILAVNNATRLSAAPEIPTAIEEGVADMIGLLFLGIFAPAATPKPVVNQIAQATQEAMADKDFKDALEKSGFEPVNDMGPEKSLVYLAEEQKRWAPVLASLGMKVN